MNDGHFTPIDAPIFGVQFTYEEVDLLVRMIGYAREKLASFMTPTEGSMAYHMHIRLLERQMEDSRREREA